MIKRIKAAGIWVSDQQKAFDFYVNKLGFEVLNDTVVNDYRWLEVVPTGTQTALALAKPYPGQEGATVGGFANIILSTDDIEATYEDLVGKGVHFNEKPTQQPWGAKQAIFSDPDGNIFVLVEQG